MRWTGACQPCRISSASGPTPDAHQGQRRGPAGLPGRAGREVTGIVEDVKGVVTDPIRALSVYDQVSRRWEACGPSWPSLAACPPASSAMLKRAARHPVPTIDTPTEQDAAMANGAAFTAL